MNKPLLFLFASLAITSAAQANAAYFNSADVKARQLMVQAATETGVATSGARATATQDAQNVAVSSRIAKPTGAESRADELSSAVYAQSGPSMAAMAANNTPISRQLPSQTTNLGTPAVERWMEEAATP